MNVFVPFSFLFQDLSTQFLLVLHSRGSQDRFPAIPYLDTRNIHFSKVRDNDALLPT